LLVALAAAALASPYLLVRGLRRRLARPTTRRRTRSIHWPIVIPTHFGRLIAGVASRGSHR
jgi:hypothetical protein